jgi:hypothetical protein
MAEDRRRCGQRTIQQQYLTEIRTPFMAYPDAREQVDESGVVYRLQDGNVRVYFEGERYRTV